MLVETSILDGHDGVLHNLWDALLTDHGPVLHAVEVGQQGTVTRVDTGGLGQVDVLLLVQLGCILAQSACRPHAEQDSARNDQGKKQGHKKHDHEYETRQSLDTGPILAPLEGGGACDSTL